MLKSSVRVTLFAVILFLAAAAITAPADLYEYYTIKSGDTLESISVKIFSELPGSEPDPMDNRFRGFLIYKENTGSAGLSVCFRNYSGTPEIVLKPGEKLKIPVFREGYPSVSELQSSIAREIQTVQEDIKRKSEEVLLQKLSDSITDELYQITLSSDNQGELILQDAVYGTPPYKLTDNTIIPQTVPSELNIFVWKIFEHEKAKKTIFLFPETFTDTFGSYRKFLIMNSILEHNRGKDIQVLVESFQPGNYSEEIADFADFRDSTAGYFDFPGILNSCSDVPDSAGGRKSFIPPSLALFAQYKNVNITGLSNSEELQKLISDRHEKIADQTEKEIEMYREGIQNHFERYAALRTDLFLKETETSIIRAFEKQNNWDNRVITQINELEIEFARALAGGINLANRLSPGEEKKISNILTSIDEISRSSTAEIFTAFTRAIEEKFGEKEFLLREIAEIAANKNEILLKEIKSSVTNKSDENISAIFSSLPDGSVGISELSIERINNQIAYGLQQGEYNLVVFYHPLFNGYSGEVSACQLPADYESIFASHILEDSYFDSLFIPEYFREEYESHRDTRDAINKNFAMLQSMGLYFEDSSLTRGIYTVYQTKIIEHGAIIRIAGMDDNGSISVGYFFIPGNTVEDRINSIERMVKEEKLNDSDRKIFVKYLKVLHASIEL